MAVSGPGVAVVPAAASSTSASPAAPVLAEIRFRDHVLVIRSGARDGDLRYDVQDRAGQLLARSLTRGELGRQFPAIAEQFHDSTALPLDASLGATSGREDSREAPPRR